MSARGERFLLNHREINGALGDLGTLLPLMLGAIAVAGLAPLPVLVAFGAFYVATALYYRLPVPVQPMKAVVAVLLTTAVTPASLAASGIIIGLLLLVLGLTGWITRLARLVPQSVLAGLQLGLGLALALVAIDLMATGWVVGAATLALLLLFLLVPGLPSAFIALAAAIAMAQAANAPGIDIAAAATTGPVLPAIPAWSDIEQAISLLVLPQLSLTFTNAILITALVAGDYFGDRAAHVTPARLSVSTGLANLLTAPFGALPMCHGAGGLAAHHRYGSRS